jgi:hypothetical protein
MKMIPLRSIDLVAVGYDETRRVLAVEVRSGAVTEYYGVPPTVYDALVSAKTPYIYYKEKISEGRYEWRRPMKMIPLESVDIVAVGYDTSGRILEVELKSGASFEYYDVPPEVYDGLINAQTPYHFFKKRIYKGPYEWKQLKK